MKNRTITKDTLKTGETFSEIQLSIFDDAIFLRQLRDEDAGEAGGSDAIYLSILQLEDLLRIARQEYILYGK